MSVNEKVISQFASEAQLSQSELRAIMYPKSHRSARVPKQEFIPPTDTPQVLTLDEESDVPKHTQKRRRPVRVNTKNVSKKEQRTDQESNAISNFFQNQEQKFQDYRLRVPEIQLHQYMEFKSIRTQPGYAVFCFAFYRLVKRTGGFINVLAYNKLEDLALDLQAKFNITRRYPTSMYFSIYKKYVLTFEMFKSEYLKLDCSVDVDVVKTFSHQEMDQIHTNRLQDSEFDRDIFVVDNFSGWLGYNLQILSIEYFSKRYGEKTIDARIQRSDAMGFNVFNSRMTNHQKKMTMEDYFTYQSVHGTPQAKNHPILGKLNRKEVCFAVNVDLIGKPDIEEEIHSKLRKAKYFQYINQLDALSYCDDWIPGCNHPQLYFKVKGVWTGGHQENVSMCSINVNFGPDSSEWFSLAPEHVPRLRRQVIQQFSIDIIAYEGLWFVPAQWLISNNYPVKKLIQKRGDLVYSAPGTLHWVRSLGKCFQAAWNLFPKKIKQWQAAKQRMRINQQIHFGHVFMPLKALAVKILNHEYHLKNPFVYGVYQSVKEWFTEETEFANAYIRNGSQLIPQYRELRDIDSLCQNCRTEVLTIYSLDVDSKVLCIRCYAMMSPKLRSQVYLKYHQQDVKELLTRVITFNDFGDSENLGEVEGMCNGRFCGVVVCSHPDKQTSSQLSSHSNTETEVSGGILIQQSLAKPESTLVFSPVSQMSKVNVLGLLQLFSTILPRRSWSSTEEVLERIQEALNPGNPTNCTESMSRSTRDYQDTQINQFKRQ